MYVYIYCFYIVKYGSTSKFRKLSDGFLKILFSLQCTSRNKVDCEKYKKLKKSKLNVVRKTVQMPYKRLELKVGITGKLV